MCDSPIDFVIRVRVAASVDGSVGALAAARTSLMRVACVAGALADDFAITLPADEQAAARTSLMRVACVAGALAGALADAQVLRYKLNASAA